MSRSISYLCAALIIALTLALVVTAQSKPECPTIEVTGPAGLIYPGDTAIFTTNADLDLKVFKLQWTVSSGTIISERGAPWIEVQTDPMYSNDTIIATVEVRGLPDGCRNVASQTAHIRKRRHPIPLDEYERVTLKEERERLDAVASEWRKYPHWYLYIILYVAPKETRTSELARIKRIKDHLTRTHRIPEERLVFVNGGILRRSTKIYGVAEASPKRDRE